MNAMLIVLSVTTILSFALALYFLHQFKKYRRLAVAAADGLWFYSREQSYTPNAHGTIPVMYDCGASARFHRNMIKSERGFVE